MNVITCSSDVHYCATDITNSDTVQPNLKFPLRTSPYCNYGMHFRALSPSLNQIDLVVVAVKIIITTLIFGHVT